MWEGLAVWVGTDPRPTRPLHPRALIPCLFPVLNTLPPIPAQVVLAPVAAFVADSPHAPPREVPLCPTLPPNPRTWRAFSHSRFKVLARQTRRRQTTMRQVLRGWRAFTQRLLAVRKRVVASWNKYSVSLMKPVFLAM